MTWMFWTVLDVLDRMFIVQLFIQYDLLLLLISVNKAKTIVTYYNVPCKSFYCLFINDEVKTVVSNEIRLLESTVLH